jgi:hypothetical protein
MLELVAGSVIGLFTDGVVALAALDVAVCCVVAGAAVWPVFELGADGTAGVATLRPLPVITSTGAPPVVGPCDMTTAPERSDITFSAMARCPGV